MMRSFPFVRGGAPESNLTVLAARSQDAAIRRKRDMPIQSVILQPADLLPGCRIPQSNILRLTVGGKPTAVRRERHIRDLAIMASKRLDNAVASDIDDSHRIVLASDCQKGAIRRKRRSKDFAGARADCVYI